MLIETAQPIPTRRRIGATLRRKLIVADVVGIMAAWAPLLVWEPSRATLLVVGASTAATILCLAIHGVYRRTVTNNRIYEAAHVYEAAIFGAIFANIVASELDLGLPAGWFVAAAAIGGVLLHLGRLVNRATLARANKAGRYLRPAVLAGPEGDVASLANRLRDNPELGYSVVGTIDDPDPRTLPQMAQSVGGETVMVVPGAVRSDEMARLVRGATNAGLHVHLVGGMSGIDIRRLQPVPLGRDASLHIGFVTIDGWKAVAKRAFDLVVTTLLLIVAAPVFLAVAIVIKRDDGGPVLFRQERIGRRGRPFVMYKFRSMVVDAEARRDDVEAANQRSGPLFKAVDDPRVTRVGRVLRAASLDELPQLFNVLKGEMSLVGPRPALAHEVERFDDELLRRHDVLPGITGLWQVEGRDVPDFSVYQETDLFYVENWSVALDLKILVRTMIALALRAARKTRPSEAAAVLD